jgi:hypothetical protein
MYQGPAKAPKISGVLQSVVFHSIHNVVFDELVE